MAALRLVLWSMRWLIAAAFVVVTLPLALLLGAWGRLADVAGEGAVTLIDVAQDLFPEPRAGRCPRCGATAPTKETDDDAV